jgi:hypothetical protein
MKFGADDDDSPSDWSREQEKSWYRQGIHTLTPCWLKAVGVDEDCEKIGLETTRHSSLCLIFVI